MTTPHKPTPRETAIGCAVMLVLCLALGAGCRGCLSWLANKRAEEGPSESEAWTMAKQFIKDRLKSPATADFGDQYSSDTVTRVGKDEFTVKGWVDAQNGFGAKVRTDFTLRLKHTGGDRWRLVDEPVITQR
jgi:hypothetical protein